AHIRSAAAAPARFQCLNRHEQPSSSDGVQSFVKGIEFQCLNRHEQPSSICSAGLPFPTQSFNASIGTSNLQATRSPETPTARTPFQCLNRHEQPSSSWRLGL